MYRITKRVPGPEDVNDPDSKVLDDDPVFLSCLKMINAKVINGEFHHKTDLYEAEGIDIKVIGPLEETEPPDILAKVIRTYRAAGWFAFPCHMYDTDGQFEAMLISESDHPNIVEYAHPHMKIATTW